MLSIKHTLISSKASLSNHIVCADPFRCLVSKPCSTSLFSGSSALPALECSYKGMTRAWPIAQISKWSKQNRIRSCSHWGLSQCRLYSLRELKGWKYWGFWKEEENLKNNLGGQNNAPYPFKEFCLMSRILTCSHGKEELRLCQSAQYKKAIMAYTEGPA